MINLSSVKHIVISIEPENRRRFQEKFKPPTIEGNMSKRLDDCHDFEVEEHGNSTGSEDRKREEKNGANEIDNVI